MNIGYDEIEEKKIKINRLKKLIIISIIILSVLAALLVALIIYKKDNPTYITTYIDKIRVQNFDKIIDPALAQLEEHLTVEVTWKSRGPWFKSGKPDFLQKILIKL